MDVASIAAAFIAQQAGQLQMAVAAKMLRMSAESGAAANAVKLIEAAQQNFDRLANVTAGLGGNLDISV
jgi:hypothetical protein